MSRDLIAASGPTQHEYVWRIVAFPTTGHRRPTVEPVNARNQNGDVTSFAPEGAEGPHAARIAGL